jgi:hypothetical protein
VKVFVRVCVRYSYSICCSPIQIQLHTNPACLLASTGSSLYREMPPVSPFYSLEWASISQ